MVSFTSQLVYPQGHNTLYPQAELGAQNWFEHTGEEKLNLALSSPYTNVGYTFSANLLMCFMEMYQT
jgi:hypothetical protein